MSDEGYICNARNKHQLSRDLDGELVCADCGDRVHRHEIAGQEYYLTADEAAAGVSPNGEPI